MYRYYYKIDRLINTDSITDSAKLKTSILLHNVTPYTEFFGCFCGLLICRYLIKMEAGVLTATKLPYRR